MSNGASTQPSWHGRFLMLAAIWGSSFLLIKIGDETLAPLQVALGRMVVGAGTLLFVLFIRRERLPQDPGTWRHLAIAALLLNAVPYSLFAFGETHVSSILAGIWNATTPLLALLAAIVTLPDERPTRRRTYGMLLGFAGVLVVLGIWQGVGGHSLVGSLACLGAACCYGLGYPYTRKHLSGRPESILALSAAQLLCGAVELAIVTPLFTTAPTSVPPRVIASIVALGALGTGVAFILNYGLIRDAGATTASTVTYVIPLFSTVAGALFLGEYVTWNQPVGAMLVILGVAISQGRVRAILPRRVVARRTRSARQSRASAAP
jgi:drug/metabolite transporter (DMT)-like permease